jgi:hypothetical protein
MLARPLAFAAALLGLSSALEAKTLAYEDNKLNFKSCSGAHVTARWVGSNLSLSEAGKSPGDPAPTAAFQTWDGRCASFAWDTAAGALVIKDGDTALSDRFLRVVSWDGARWAALRTGAGFFLIRIADKDAADPAAGMKPAGEWLAKNNKLGVPAADILARALQGGEKVVN